MTKEDGTLVVRCRVALGLAFVGGTGLGLTRDVSNAKRLELLLQELHFELRAASGGHRSRNCCLELFGLRGLCSESSFEGDQLRLELELAVFFALQLAGQPPRRVLLGRQLLQRGRQLSLRLREVALGFREVLLDLGFS